MNGASTNVRRAALISALAFLLGETGQAQAEPASIWIRTDSEINLVYQLDCLTNVVDCSHPSYSELWRNLPRRENDARWLTQWKHRRIALHTRSARARAGNSSQHPFDSPLHVANRRPLNLSAEDYETMAHFQSRFDRWWRETSGNHLQRMQLSLTHLSATTDLPALLEALAGFHELPGDALHPVDVFLLAAPGPPNSPTHAEIRGDRAFVESRIGESGSVRLGVVAHEVAHYYYSLTTTARRKIIRDWFLENDRAWAIPAYHLFNEALAAAFGNGIVEARLLTESQFAEYAALPESYYANIYVDAAAKATQPLLEEYFRADRVLDRAFVDRYVGAVGKASRRHMADLGFWLRSMAFTTTSTTLGTMVGAVSEHIVTGALFQESFDVRCTDPCVLQRYPELSGIVVTLAEDAVALKEFLPDSAVIEITRNAFVHGHSIFGYQRSPRSLLFVVSGRTEADVEDGLLRLFQHGSIFTGEMK